MNSLSLRSKSLLFSIGMHLLVVFAAIILIYEFKEPTCACGSAMKMTKLNLSSLAPEQVVEQPDKLLQEKKRVSKPHEKVEKEVNKRVVTNTPVLKQVELKEVKKTPFLATKEEETEKPQKVEEELAKEAVEQRLTKSVVAQTDAQMNASSVQNQDDLRIACEKQYMHDNIALINALIKENLYYPRIAKKRGIQGKTMVAFTLNTKGEISEIKALGDIASILSKAAIKTIQKAAASFPHPKVELSLQIPIVYKLAQR